MKTALFPGSFDPFTVGHYDVVLRGLELFDKVIVAIGKNTSKKSFFSEEKKIKLIETAFSGIPQIEVLTYDGLTVDFCNKNNAAYILRGLRNSTDFNYERNIAQVNQMMYHHIETVFLLTKPEYAAISSTIVREIYKHGGNINDFLPKGIDINTI